MKILVVGHRGMLGSELMKAFGAHHEVEGRDVDRLDITSLPQCLDAVADSAPQAVINAAAYTDVEGSEHNYAQCSAINGDGVRNLAVACSKFNRTMMVHFSTDYVFDGTKGAPYEEEDTCTPINAYGRSKLEGECNLREELPGRHILIRTSWLFGKNGKNFVRSIIEKAESQRELSVVNDQIGSPTYAKDLAHAVNILVEGGHRGTFHITNRGRCSWYEYACKIVEYACMKGIVVTPVSSADYRTEAARPAYSVLSSRKFMKVTHKTMRFWQVALSEFIEKMNY